MNSRSPRVVSMRRMPRRGVSGKRMARMVNNTSRLAITQKNSATGKVQAIQPPAIIGANQSLAPSLTGVAQTRKPRIAAISAAAEA